MKILLFISCVYYNNLIKKKWTDINLNKIKNYAIFDQSGSWESNKILCKIYIMDF